MAEALEKKALHTIITKAERAIWITFKEEILIDGHLFDVEFYKQSGDNLELTGLYDTEEDHLNEQIKNITHQKSKKNTEEYTLLLSLLFQTYVDVNDSSLNQNVSFTGLNNSLFAFAENLRSAATSIVLPPPKI